MKLRWRPAAKIKDSLEAKIKALCLHQDLWEQTTSTSPSHPQNRNSTKDSKIGWKNLSPSPDSVLSPRSPAAPPGSRQTSCLHQPWPGLCRPLGYTTGERALGVPERKPCHPTATGLHPGPLTKLRPQTDMEIHVVVPVQHGHAIVCSDPGRSGGFSVT